ncbi:hypothetical protein [Hyphomonas sp.]|uniref:hypothetical protein n=1 Tax=Hyphomonas sp. TaxID=87 RepID=UPI001DE9185D|nr:hypothetical protein [Hyphomonas sp.]MBU4062081.1 hypothetical protein [Alphaproteobacteria bacterium]MBU4165017.1 hypothetical protein [Alphaproteobacteria bacterium]
MKFLNTNFRTPMIVAPLLAAVLGACATTEAVAPPAEDSVEAKINRAMLAAPPDISGAAKIVDMDGTVLREGNNGWTCIPGIPLIPGDEHPMCNDETWTAWLKAAMTSGEFSTDVIGVSYMLQGDAMVHNMDPTATVHDHSGMWVQDGPHLMMLFPTASEIAALPRDPYAGGPYVMWDKTPLVHVMVPVEPKTR